MRAVVALTSRMKGMEGDPRKPTGHVAEGPVEERLLGKDEMNLAEFPITLLSERRGVNMITREVVVREERTGLSVIRKVTVTGSDKDGLPTSQDNLILLALIYLTKRANNFTDRRLWFTRTALLRVLGWPDSGQSYRRIELSLKRWGQVFVLYENAWWDKPKQSYSTKGFGIIDDFELNDASMSRQQLSLFQSNIAWNEVFFQSLEAGFVRTLDLKILSRLRHPTSQQMYRFLGKHFYHSPTLTLDLRTFACEHVGLDRSYKDNGKLKEKLQPALDELEELGFLEPMSREERYAKVGPKLWTVTLKRRADLELDRLDEADAVDGPLVGPELTKHEQELVERGVTPATAAEIAVAYPADQIQAKLEAFDWLMSKKDKRVSKNPAGYLAESIRKKYAPPRGFESKSEKERRLAAESEQRRKVEEAKRQAEAEQKAREEAEQARIKKYWNSLSPARQKALTSEALEQGDMSFAITRYRRTKDDAAVSERYLKMILDAYILKKLSEE
jgi:hypothetical protein